MIVPALPPIAPEFLEEHAQAHRSQTDAIDRLEVLARRVFIGCARRIVTESFANVQSVRPGSARPLLFPPPRAFLAPAAQLRMLGADACFRYVDSRLAMVRGGLAKRMLEPSAPFAIHALAEGLSPSGRELNAGMLRGRTSTWNPTINPLQHPPADHCPELVESAISLAAEAPAPPIARAAWLTFTMLSIHPFADGNGRTSRVLFHLVALDDPDIGFEWGVAEQWMLHRDKYVATLAAGQQGKVYDPATLDPLPFMVFSVQASTAGALLTAERARRTGEAFEFLAGFRGLSPMAAAVALRLAIERISTLEEFTALGLESGVVVRAIDDVIAVGLADWGDRPPSRRTLLSPDHRGLVATPELVGLVRQ
jgi:hypothetical protein